MDLRKLSMRQHIGVALLSTFLIWCLIGLAFGGVGSIDEGFWFLVVLFASLLVPVRLTPHLLAFWGLFFGALSLALGFGVQVVGSHEWGREAGAIAFGTAFLALLASAVVAGRKARPGG